MTLWAALETLVEPGGRDIGKRLASCLATLIEPPGRKRTWLFQMVRDLYDARCRSSHASYGPEDEQLMASFDVGRRAFIACIERRLVPNATALLQSWKLGH